MQRRETAIDRALERIAEHPLDRGPAYRAALRGVLGTLRGMQAAGRRLDDVLHSSWADTPVAPPLWIIACPRSGTTFLHRLLTLDAERFSALQLYQTLLPPVSWTRAFATLAATDKRLGKPVSATVDQLEKSLFGDYDDIHRVSFGEPEEDEAFFMSEGASPAWLMFLPFVEGMEELVWADDLPAEERERLASRYSDFLRRQVYADPQRRTLLLKNALIAGRLSLIEGAVQGTRYVHLVRDPYRSVPSLVSMFYAVLSRFHPDIAPDSDVVKRLAQMGCDYYLAYHRHCLALPPERVITVRYDDLIANPLETVESIYAHFDFPISPAFEERLTSALRAQRSYTSRHSYSLRKFGLRPSDIHVPLAEVFAYHDFAVEED